MSDKPEYTQYAFPMVTAFHPQMGIQADPGMTLRDWFAGMAMQGMVAASGDSDGVVGYTESVVSKNAYLLADAMLAARKGNQ